MFVLSVCVQALQETDKGKNNREQSKTRDLRHCWTKHKSTHAKFGVCLLNEKMADLVRSSQGMSLNYLYLSSPQ